MPAAFSVPEFMPGVPILPPSPRHNIASRSDFESRFPVRAGILRQLEEALTGSPLSTPEILAIRSALCKLNNLDLYIDEHSEGKRSVLREGQFQAFQSYSRFLEMGGADGYIKLPPRTGKTVLFISFIDALGLHKLGEKCLIVVPSQYLADQTKARFEEFAPHLKADVHYSGSKTIRKNTRKSSRGARPEEETPERRKDHRDTRFNWSELPEVTIIVKDSLRNLESSGTIRKGDFSTIFLDEGHEMLGKKTSRAIDKLRDPRTSIVAFTATPKYSEIKNLRVFLGPEIHAMSIQEAVAMGMLTPFTVVTAESEVDLSAIDIDLGRGEYSPRQLESAMYQKGINKSVIELLQSDLLAGRSTIVFTATNRQAEDIAEMARDAGISCEAIGQRAGTRKTRDSVDERKRKIQGHKDGSIQVLAGPKLLGTGYDNARVSAVVILVPFTSPVPVEQFSTRPLTPDPNHPDKVGIVVQYLHRERRMQHRQMTFLDCIYGSSIDRYLGQRTGEPARESATQLEVQVPGLVVTVKPTEVLKVLRKRPEPVPPHEIDDAQAAYRELSRRRDALLWATPKALREAAEAAKQMSFTTDGRRFAADIRSLRARVKTEDAQSLSITSSEKMLLLRRHTYGEAVRHFQRRHDVELPQEPILLASQASIRIFRKKVETALRPLQQLAEAHGVTPRAITAFCDPRISKAGMEDAWTRGFTNETRAEIARQASPTLETLHRLEQRMKLRWDVTLRIGEELEDLDAKMNALKAHDRTESVIRFAEERAAEFIEERRKKGGLFLDDPDTDSSGPLTTEEVRNIAISAAIDVAMRPKMLGTLKKFSRTAAEEIRAALERELEQLSYDGVSFSPKDRAGGMFKSWAEYSGFDRFVEAHVARTGRPVVVADVMRHYKIEDDREAHGRLAEYHTIGPIESLEGLPRVVTRNIEDSRVAMNGDAPTRLRHEDLRTTLDRVLKTLTHRERDALKLRYGLLGEQAHTLEELANIFKVTKERVRQVIAKAERKLQHPVRARHFRDFTGPAPESPERSEQVSDESEDLDAVENPDPQILPP